MQTEIAELDTLLARLRTVGEKPPRKLFDEILAHGQDAVAPLIALATEERLYLPEEDSPAMFAPYHAIRLLGEVGAPEAIEPLLTLLDKDDDYLHQYLPESLGRIGRPAVAPLTKALSDPHLDVYGVAKAANALVRIADLQPDLRSEIVGVLIGRLDASIPLEAIIPGVDSYSLRGFLISDLAELRATEAMPSIQQAYDEDLVDEFLIDRETYETIMTRPEGVSAGEALQKKSRLPLTITKMTAATSEPTASPVGSRTAVVATASPDPTPPKDRPKYTGPKVGRNDRCPCGRGKKYKRCCGA